MRADVDLGAALDDAIGNLDTSITETGAEIVRQDSRYRGSSVIPPC